MRLLGIDYGSKRIGVALSDEIMNGKGASFAFPHKIIENNGIKKTTLTIKKIVAENDVSKIILGRSLDFKGKPNPIMKEIEKFKSAIEKEIELSVEYEDEVLTSSEARKSLSMPEGRPRGVVSRIRIGKSSSFGRKLPVKQGPVDAKAAALILKSYIEKQ